MSKKRSPTMEWLEKHMDGLTAAVLIVLLALFFALAATVVIAGAVSVFQAVVS